MRAHLSAQILSKTVIDMMNSNISNKNERKKYDSLIAVITLLNNVINIWNHPKCKRFWGNKDNERYSNIKKRVGKLFQITSI